MIRLVDVSRWQVERSDPLDLAQAKSVGYSIANLALTGGRGYVAGSWLANQMTYATALGMGRSTYHWLDGRTSGVEQAETNLARLRNLFGVRLERFGHVVDVEEDGKNGIAPPTWAHVHDYVGTMQEALGRPIAIYSADYWWKPRGWSGASLTPYLMGPPNTPVQAEPAADSPAWAAGWGGWRSFSILQWGVRPLPGTGGCSLSLIRDPAVWAAMSGGDPMPPTPSWVLVPCLVALREEFNRVSPTRDKASDGSIGDAAHAQDSSDHNPDETGKTPFTDSDAVNEVHAIDIDDSGPWPAPGWFDAKVEAIRRAHAEGRDVRLQNIIRNGRIASRSWGWAWRPYTGANPHDKHAHFSARYTTEQENDTRPWGVAPTPAPPPEEDDMATISQADFNARMDAWWSARLAPGVATPQASALRVAPWHQRVGAVGSPDTTYSVLLEMRANLRATMESVMAMLQRDVPDAEELAQIKAHIDRQVSQAARDVLAGLAAGGADADEIAELLRVALGARAAEVGARLAAGR